MRTKNFRVIRVRLECGCSSDLFTGRYRVSKALVGILAQDAVRRGVWCAKCKARCLPTELVGVVAAEHPARDVADMARWGGEKG
jgi:hypothetical protein